jgi:alanine racemase
MEIDLGRLRRDLPPAVKLLAVVKDEAYGHGANWRWFNFSR